MVVDDSVVLDPGPSVGHSAMVSTCEIWPYYLKSAKIDNFWLFLSLKDTWYVDQTTALGHLPTRPADLGPVFVDYQVFLR